MTQKILLDKFGKFIVDNLRDKGISFADKLLKEEWKAPELIKLQAGLVTFSDIQKDIIRDIVKATIDNTIHDFLFSLQDNNEIQLSSEGEDITHLSDGVHGEALGDDGWFKKYSKF